MTKYIRLTDDLVVSISDESYKKVRIYDWFPYKKNNKCYAVRYKRVNGRYIRVFMHDDIMRPSQGKKVYHRDGDTLNNARENLSARKRKKSSKGVSRHIVAGYAQNWPEISKQIRERDGCCVKCNSLDRLSVHHIDEDKANNDDRNLVTLCWPCHRKVHHELARGNIVTF